MLVSHVLGHVTFMSVSAWFIRLTRATENRIPGVIIKLPRSHTEPHGFSDDDDEVDARRQVAPGLARQGQPALVCALAQDSPTSHPSLHVQAQVIAPPAGGEVRTLPQPSKWASGRQQAGTE